MITINLFQTVRLSFRPAAHVLVVGAMAWVLTGCAPTYRELRIEGQRATLRGDHGPARYFYLEAEKKKPNHVDNLHDLGFCSFMLARQRFEQVNRAAAMREVETAVDYYNRAIEVHPGHRASITGKNLALELKGQFDEALEHAEWVAEFVGPSAEQHIFLARELEERGDVSGALLRYRQAAAMEPHNPDAHVALAKFLLRHGNEGAAVYHLRVAYHLAPRDEWVANELIIRGQLPPIAPDEGSP